MTDSKVRLERNAPASNDQCASRHVLEFNARCRGLGSAVPRSRQGQAGTSAGTMERAAGRELVQATFAVQFAISPVLDCCEFNADTRRANGSGVSE